MSSVTQYSFPVSLPWSDGLVAKLSEREYRHAYMVEGVKTWIARQVRTLREQRDWSQDDLGREASKPQSAISRVEDPDYGKLTLQTLFDLAHAYDLPLLVQFVEWSDWLSRMDDSSKPSLEKEGFSATALTNVGVGQLSISDQITEAALAEYTTQAVQALYPSPTTATGYVSGIGAAYNLNLLTGSQPTATQITPRGLAVSGWLIGEDLDFFDHQRNDSEDYVQFPRVGALVAAEAENG